MAEPMILEVLSNLKSRVATNETNIAKNSSTITANKKLFDTHAADDTRHWTTADRQNFDRVVHFKGYFTTIDKLKEAYPTGQLGDYAIVGGTDTVWLWDDETNSWLNSTEQGIVISVNGRTGEVILTKTDVGLSNVDNTSDVNKPLSTAAKNSLNAKADRKKITLAEADGMTLKAGIYDLYNISKTILNFTSKYWTVIVGEQQIATKALYGDINGDGVIDQSDVDLFYNFIAGTETLTDAQQTIADLNKDGKANIKDWNRLTDYVVNGASSDIIGTAVDATEAEIKPATQIWMNYGDGEVQHIYMRRQQGGTSWSDFKELATNTDVSNLQSQITTNKNNIATNKTNIETNKKNIATNTTNIATNKKNIETNTTDISNLKINKANRGNITLDQANALTGLQSGIYSLCNVTVTLAGDKYTNNWFSVIVCDWADGSTIRQSSQIWIPFSTGATTTAYIRHQKLDTDGTTRTWGDFIKIANQSQIDNLQSQINTNKTNISNLDENKADRKKATIAELDTNTLRAGTYFCRESKTILGATCGFWNVIVNEQNTATDSSGIYSASQIWITSESESTYHIFFRKHIKTTSWGSFVELYTTNDMSKDDISRFKQYKGYFTDLIALRAAHSTAKAGDYAIAGTSLYVWDSDKNLWTEISGGGSTGSGKWSIKQYDAPKGLISSGVPYMKDLVGLTFEGQWELDDNATVFSQSKVDYKVFLIETWVKMNADFEWTQTLTSDDGCSVYLNGKVIKTLSTSTNAGNVAFNFKKGWNRLQILLRELAGTEKFAFSSKLTTETQCLGIDCYHSENALTEGYVPLVGNSTIEGNLKTTGTMTVGSNATVNGTLTTTGNITSGGTVGVTSNAYLKYNIDEKSISFIFN